MDVGKWYFDYDYVSAEGNGSDDTTIVRERRVGSIDVQLWDDTAWRGPSTWSVHIQKQLPFGVCSAVQFFTNLEEARQCYDNDAITLLL